MNEKRTCFPKILLKNKLLQPQGQVNQKILLLGGIIKTLYSMNFDFKNTVFPRINTGGDYFFFVQKEGDYLREGNNYYSREAIISNIVHWKLCPKYFVIFSH